MADVRINGKRFPVLQSVDKLGTLVARLEAYGTKEGVALTTLYINGSTIDLDNAEYMKLKLDAHDTIEARMESAEDLALQSLNVAQEMAELLVFDLKVATLNLWENTRSQAKTLETLLKDCHLFLSLGARPLDLLGHDPRNTEKPIENRLRQLDRIANNVEDAVFLAALNKQKDACRVLVGCVIPAIETWLKLSVEFAEHLRIGEVNYRVDGSSNDTSKHLATP